MSDNDAQMLCADVRQLERRLSALEQLVNDGAAVQGVWPEFVYINGHPIKCNRRARNDGSTPLSRAMVCCAELRAKGIRPSYKALRCCHFGSVTAKQALVNFMKESTPVQDK